MNWTKHFTFITVFLKLGAISSLHSVKACFVQKLARKYTNGLNEESMSSSLKSYPIRWGWLCEFYFSLKSYLQPYFHLLHNLSCLSSLLLKSLLVFPLQHIKNLLLLCMFQEDFIFVPTMFQVVQGHLILEAQQDGAEFCNLDITGFDPSYIWNVFSIILMMWPLSFADIYLNLLLKYHGLLT